MRRNATNNIQKTPQLKFIAIAVIATSAILVFTVTPWNIVPTMITEDVAVIAVTDYGCVGESNVGRSVVVPNCDASVGDIVSATFYIPAGEINGYLEELDRRQNHGGCMGQKRQRHRFLTIIFLYPFLTHFHTE